MAAVDCAAETGRLIKISDYIKILHESLECSIAVNNMYPTEPYYMLLPHMHTLDSVSNLARKLFILFPNVFYSHTYDDQKCCDNDCLDLLNLYDYMSKLREIAFNGINDDDRFIKAYVLLDHSLIYNPWPLESRLCGTGKFTKSAPRSPLGDAV
jgi:hypothetical protein